MDQDGQLEVIIGCSDFSLFCFTNEGFGLWIYETENIIHSSPCAVDLDNNNFLELVFGSDDGYLYCLSSSGSTLWRYNTQTSLFGSPIAVDINHDNKLEILVGSSQDIEDDFWLYCFSLTGIRRSGPEQWSSFKGGIFRTGQPDSDSDFLDDVTETTYSNAAYSEFENQHLDPNDPDTDDDELSDYEELFVFGTNPLNADTDGDGYIDGREIEQGGDPNDPTSVPKTDPWQVVLIIILSLLGALTVSFLVYFGTIYLRRTQAKRREKISR